MAITEVTRRGIVDALVAAKIDWAGRLRESDFLSRLYDLNSLPSDDYRFETAAGDIGQHRDNFRDWEDEWVFYDRRFNLLYGPDETFLRFLCETVHPTVRADPADARRVVEFYNDQLRRDGWEIYERAEISGRPVFAARAAGAAVEIFREPTGWPKIDRQIEEIRLRVREARNEEQYQSIGHLCREVLITVAQTVYERDRHPTLDGVPASTTDAKRMLDAYFAVELAGQGNADARKHARAAFDMANGLQHDRKASFRDAALCAEAALSVVRIVAIVSGRRERTELD